MTHPFSPLIQPQELLELQHSKNLILVDASNGKDAYANYQRQHLDKALFVDLNTELADIKEDVTDGGRHPLPTIEQFSKTLSRLGISKESHVVVYDDKMGANAAARFWWMLKAVGHEKVQVLDGGFQEAERVGFPINSKVVSTTPTTYFIEDWKLPLATMDEVEAVVQDTHHIVIDVRDSERYRGEKEPIDLIAGHIPGAINIPFTENLTKNGVFLSSEKLKEKYLNVFNSISSDKIIVHCGSGVTACHTLLAIATAGLDIPKLYVGSWSEWSRNKM
ncbi:sulfurtransferase [Flavobacterium soli]|uniref:sulfurtransferase n=1 Tax=Flavobacterium soli TaxID=344881 RepID=UPI00040810B6|nr:sulfurtransferase [Flavobacterium soli]